MKKLSIIIPCYNESENLKRGVLTEVDNYLKTQKFSWEVIISDDESTDNSWNLVEDFIKGKNHYLHLKNKHGGKPFALRNGLEKASGDWVLFTDMDQATPIDQLDKLRPNFDKADIVIGSRGSQRKNYPLYRQIGSLVFLNIRRYLLCFLPKIKDTQCGFKAFKREVALKVFPLLQVFQVKTQVFGWRVSSYDVELLFIANKFSYRIIEVAIKWEDTDVTKSKKRSYFKESKNMLIEILRVRLNDWQGKYD